MVCELLAEYLGIYITVIAAVFMVRYDTFIDYAEEFAENTYMRFNLAFVELGVGLAIVLLHNTWTLDYRGVVSVLGWLMIVESVFHFLASDEQEEEMIDRFTQSHHWRYYGLIALFLGLYLMTKGFRGF